MKPDWKDAPEWAQWLAAEKECPVEVRWFWYAEKPTIHDAGFWVGGKCRSAGMFLHSNNFNWRETLEQRPE